MKFFIKDEETGKDYSVEEVIEEKSAEDEVPETEEALSKEDIVALKSLASVADKLIELVKEDADVDEDIDKDIDDEDEDEDEDEDDKEAVVDTDKEKMKGHDSRKSFGSIETRKTVDDSAEEDDVSAAWAKRYGGNR